MLSLVKSLWSPPANQVARATDLRVPTASAVQAKINFQIRTAPTDGINAANYESGDFGRSPFLGQLSGKPQPASAYASMLPRSKHKGASRP